jgi:enoyl-CoA hydratase/carnithine racemase
MTKYETLQYDEVDGVAWVTMNRPEAHNAFTIQMTKEIHACWRELRTNDDVKVVVLTGAGDKAFTVGLDRKETEPGNPDRPMFIGNPGNPEFNKMHYDDPADWLPPKSAGDLWKPLIACVNGMAAGGALYMLGEADIIVASEDATFFDPHTTFGMAAVFETVLMANRMPLGELLRMQLMGSYERMSARRAYEIGMVQDVVPQEDLRAYTQALAATIASQPALSVQATVRAAWYAHTLGPKQGLDVAKTLLQLGTNESLLAEGTESFKNRQRATWRLR